MTTATNTTPAVLQNEYPVYDVAGNRCQFVRLRYICGHEESVWMP